MDQLNLCIYIYIIWNFEVNVKFIRLFFFKDNICWTQNKTKQKYAFYTNTLSHQLRNAMRFMVLWEWLYLPIDKQDTHSEALIQTKTAMFCRRMSIIDRKKFHWFHFKINGRPSRLVFHIAIMNFKLFCVFFCLLWLKILRKIRLNLWIKSISIIF